MISRRLFAATLLAVGSGIFIPVAFADNTDTFWERILQAFGGGDRMTDATIKLADGLDKTSVALADRSNVVGELALLNETLFEMFGRKNLFHGDIQDYVADSKSGALKDDARDMRWRAVTRDVTDLIELVGRIREVLERSTHLRRRIDPAVFTELSRSMVEREALFEELRRIPAPRTKGEIARLEAIADTSRVLLEKTQALQRSLDAARDRLIA